MGCDGASVILNLRCKNMGISAFSLTPDLQEALADLLQNGEEVASWLETPNEAFEGSTPLQVIERGESDRIWRMIYFLRSGEPT